MTRPNEVCFHRLRDCGFCWPTGKPRKPGRHRLRCSCCGRFVKKPGKIVPIVKDRCPRCTMAGYEALRLAI